MEPRRAALLGIIAFAVAAMPALGTTTATSRPAIKPARVGVPVFVGSGFTPRTLVTVTLSAGKLKSTRRVRANGSGRFVARFIDVPIDPCRGVLVVRAVDERGVGTRWKRECRPPSTTGPSLVS
jgi:hypothetical protein